MGHRHTVKTVPPNVVPPLSAAALVYLLASAALHRGVIVHLTTRATGWTSSDSALFTWWLHWTPWALLHGENPLYTTWQHAPVGVNAMWNTTTPALGILLAPVTLTIGPTAAFNVGMILGPAVSATACWAALGPYVRRWPARTIASGLYGFSPFIVAHGSVGHLNLVWALLPPFLLWAVRTVFVDPRRPWLAGAAIGAAFALQTGLYTQTVALGAVALVVVAAVLTARWPREALVRAPAVARSAIAALGVYVLFAAYPLWLLLAGPARPAAPIRDPATTGADLANVVVPSPLTKLTTGTTELAGQLWNHPGEQGSYIGIAMLVALTLAAAIVRSTALRLAVATGAVLLVLSFGVHLIVLGRETGLPLPWAITQTVPLLAEAEAGRLAVFVALAVALAFGITADRALASQRWIVVGALIGVAFTWMPSDSQQSTPVAVPAFFTAGAPGLASSDLVTVWPRPSGKWVGGARPLLWQSAASMSYRQTGGYFIGSDVSHPLLLEAPITEFETRRDPAAARRDLAARGVTAVLVVDQPDVDLPAVLSWTQQVVGRPGVELGGVWVFRP